MAALEQNCYEPGCCRHHADQQGNGPSSISVGAGQATSFNDCVAWRRGAKGDGRNTGNPVCYLSDTGIIRAPKLEHAVQGRSSDGNLGSVGARSKGIANHAFVSPDRRLDLGSQVLAAGLLPRHPADFGDHLQMAVALCRGGLGRSTRDRGCPRRHDDGSVWMTFDNR